MQQGASGAVFSGVVALRLRHWLRAEAATARALTPAGSIQTALPVAFGCTVALPHLLAGVTTVCATAQLGRRRSFWRRFVSDQTGLDGFVPVPRHGTLVQPQFFGDVLLYEPKSG